MFRDRPLWLTEWSSDSPAMIAHIIKGCLPYCQAMSQWALSSTFEELGVADYILKEGYMGWGMLVQGIATPAFNTYKLLHALGSEGLATEGPAMAARRADRSVAALVWNLADVQQPSGLPDSSHTRTVSGERQRFEVEFAAARPGQRVQVRYVDQERGSPMPAWREMGSPKYITPAQMLVLRGRAEIPPPTVMKLDAACRVNLDLPPEGVALVELMT
jgi:xylan 1,4-beta-xylosidase